MGGSGVEGIDQEAGGHAALDLEQHACGQVISRRVFTPAEYGAPAQASLAPGADLAARVLFEVKGGVPAGFLVYPFYP
jgi:hypothetical protein